MNIKNVMGFVATLLLLAGLSPTINASVGKVIFAYGTVSVERPAPGALTKGMPVDEGDTIITGKNGYVQVLLDDATKIAIRPDSRFVIDAVESPPGSGFGAVGAGVTPRAQFSLLKGGFRTMSGRIARAQPSAYRVSTPNAVIGVRGTNYFARLCASDCGGNTDDGLYVGLSDGAVFLSNNAGEVDLTNIGGFAFAANFNTPPTLLLAPPASLADEGLDVLLEEEEDESEGDSEGEGEAEEVASEFGGDSEVGDTEGTDSEAATPVTEQPDQEITAVTAGGSSVDLTDGGSTAAQGFSFSTDQFALGSRTASTTLEFNDNEELTAFQALGSSGATETYDIGTAIPHNTGFDPETSLRWGRWSEGVANVDGNDLDLNNVSLHYVLEPEQSSPAQVITGSADYVLVGNTDPTDNAGHVGVLGDASLFANFTESTVTSNLQLGINGQVWQASGTGDITSTLFSGLYSTVTVNNSPGGSGTFGGMFTGFGESTPLGAGMNYNLVNGSTTVNGAAIFNQVR